MNQKYPTEDIFIDDVQISHRINGFRKWIAQMTSRMTASSTKHRPGFVLIVVNMSKSELTSSGDDLLSEDNQELLKQLRQLIGETNASDHYLFKFLVARSKDPVKAANMFKATMEWRASYGADRLPHSSVTVTNSIRGFDFVADQDLDVTAPGVPAGWASFYHSLGPSCYHKTCKSGFPLYIDQMVRYSLLQSIQNPYLCHLTSQSNVRAVANLRNSLLATKKVCLISISATWNS